MLLDFLSKISLCQHSKVILSLTDLQLLQNTATVNSIFGMETNFLDETLALPICKQQCIFLTPVSNLI